MGDGSGRRRLGRRLAAAAILAAGAAFAGVLLLGSGSRPPKGAAANPGAGSTTSIVTRRTLTESSTIEGTLGHGAKLALYNRLAGTFTWLPTVGEVIGRGGTLWRIDNRAVVLMYGPVPAWRTVKVGIGDGPDVAELNRNLIDLGFDPYGEIDELAHFGAATAAAVRRWQEAEHLPVTGEVELGRVVFTPGARRITALEVVVGQDPPSISPAVKAPVAAEEPAAREPTAAEPAEEKEPEEPEAEKPEAERSKHEPEAGEPGKLPSAGEGPKSGGTPEAGQEPAAAEPALTTTSTRQIVQLELGAAEQSLAKVGRSAPVTLPDGNVVKGHIVEVGKVAEAPEAGGGPEGEGSEAHIPVTITLDHPVAHLDEAPVSVSLVEQVRRHVLAVQATALFATAGGRYAIEALEGQRRVRLAVKPGMFADGYVQVAGHGIHRGLKVLEPSE